MKGSEVIKLALKLKGRKYVFGAYVPKNKADYKGDFDCAEFVAFNNYQAFKILYGTETNTLKRDDAYTGYFHRDAQRLGRVISVLEAARTPGAMLLRIPQDKAIGHIVFSQGDGTTIEAYSTKYGCIESVVDGRRWSCGILLPGVDYEELKPVVSKPPTIVYRLKSPFMKDDFVGKIQVALGLKDDDNVYGPNTHSAVVAFQKKKGLIADGEVMPGGETAKELGI